jgi:hypothetical protein
LFVDVVAVVVVMFDSQGDSGFSRVYSSVFWALNVFSLFNQCSVMLDMIMTIIKPTMDCTVLNHRQVFNIFLPLPDRSGYSLLGQAGQGYIQEPTVLFHLSLFFFFFLRTCLNLVMSDFE